MKTLILLCLIPCQLFCCQDHEEKTSATIYWVNDVLYIESAGHLYYAMDVRHSINCHHDCCNDCEKRIDEKMQYTASEIIKQFDLEMDPIYLSYLLGKYEAYWECLHLIQHQGS